MLSRHGRHRRTQPPAQPLTVEAICEAVPEFRRWRATQQADERDMPLYGVHLHLLPDGRWVHALDLFDGMTLTQRVGARLDGRTDLHVTASLDPVLALSWEAPLDLRGGGGIVRQSSTLPEVVIGPAGWLPAAGPGDYLVVRFVDGQLDVTAQPTVRASLDAMRHVREVLSHQIKIDDLTFPADRLVLHRGHAERAPYRAQQPREPLRHDGRPVRDPCARPPGVADAVRRRHGTV
jgi:hypothetical protein